MTKMPVIIGNWKMYKTAREAVDYIERLTPLIKDLPQPAFLAVPFTSIAPVVKASKGYPLEIGAQNMSDAREGAFTGEIASLMLKEAGAFFVLLGHSERRLRFGETDEMIHAKVALAISDEIRPILCIGETEGQNKRGETEAVLKKQLVGALSKIPEAGASLLMIAYEPVWAIGTGNIPDPQEVEKIHRFIRSILVDLFGKKQGGSVPLLYGGSVNAENARSFTQEKHIDGLLVGGASLNPETFSLIIHECGKK
jgi:triosephosphate isomerase